MKSRRLNVSDDGLTISRRSSLSSTSMTNGNESSEPIPADLIFEILLRLASKSVARSRCVAKLWDSILRGPGFTELFFTRSSSRPQLLFSFYQDDELVFFSAPDEKSSLLVSSKYQTKFPIPCGYSPVICGHVRGSILLTQVRTVKGRKVTVPVICNPSTGQSLELPKAKARWVTARSFFAYDPIGKQFKVLSMSWPCYTDGWRFSKEHHVLTLGTGKPSWRRIECGTPHKPARGGICINGRLYYQAVESVLEVSAIVCFDITSEKFGFIKKDTGVIHWYESTLVNYKGKLAALTTHEYGKVTEQSRYIHMWVLVDAEKHEWSKHVYALPSMWKDVVPVANLYFIGMAGSDEIVMLPLYQLDRKYVFYYNFERGTLRSVEIQGLGASRYTFHTFLHHVEDVKLYATF